MISPELRRNIWLDFTFHRIIITPIVIFLIAYLFYVWGDAKDSADIVFKVACLFIFVWGIKRSSETVIEEINNNTWDFQRQSAISPWQMTWGKLIGPSLYTWYGAIICFCLYACRPFFKGAMVSSANTMTVLHDIMLLILGGLFGQALALLLSIQGLARARRDKNNRSFKYFLVALVVSGLLTDSCFMSAKAINQTVSWHGYGFSAGIFSLTSLIIFLGWAILGLQRSFCKELQYQNVPWVWLLFNLFCMIYFSGFVSSEHLPLVQFQINTLEDLENQLHHAPLYLSFFIAVLLTYFALFDDDISFIRYKYLLARLKEKNISECLIQLPWWPISFILSLLAGIMIAFVKKSSPIVVDFSPAIFALTNLLFLTRDVCLLHFFNFGKNPKRAAGASMLYLFLLYLLTPLLLSAMHLNNLLPLVLPSWGQNTLLALLSSVSQIVLLAYLCQKRWLAQLDRIKTPILEPV